MFNYNPTLNIFHPWVITLDGQESYYNNEGAFEYLRNLGLEGLEEENPGKVRQSLQGLNLMEEKQGFYFIRPRERITQLKESLIRHLNTLGNLSIAEQVRRLDRLPNKCHAFCFCKNKQ